MLNHEQNDRGARGSIPTIGYLGGEQSIEQPTQAGLIDAAKAAGVNLIIFSGGLLENPHGFEIQRNQVFELAGPENVDALIIGSDFLGHFVDAQKVQAFCEKYRPLPIVKNEPLIAGYPTLLFDFYQGMYALVSHLIEHHCYSKIGFISGPDQSASIRDRFRAYRDVLRDHHIPFDANLVVTGSIFAPSGTEAVHTFLDERRLRLGEDLQAIVGFNDYIAIDTIKALQARGVRIPEDVVVAGFDDDESAFSINPQLTTVRLPTYEIGRWGVDTLVELLAGRDVPEITTIPAMLVVRRSCGCFGHLLAQNMLIAVDQPFQAEQEIPLQQRRVEILEKVRNSGGFQRVPRLFRDVDAFVDVFLAELDDRLAGHSPDLPSVRLEEAISRLAGYLHNIEIISSDLQALQREALRFTRDEITRQWIRNWFHYAYLLASESIQRSLVKEKNQATYLDTVLHEMNQEMATTFDIDELMDVLARNLTRLNIPACYISLYDDPQDIGKMARLVLAYDKQGRITLDPAGTRFPARQLVPPGLRSLDHRTSQVVQSIFFQEEQMGFIVFETGPIYGGLYEHLVQQISSTLKRIQLHHRAVEAQRIAEEADMLKSRFLTTVSHELRTPLSMIVSMSELLLQDSGGHKQPLSAELRREMEVIHATGQHLDRLIRDVMDLGRSQLGQLELDLKLINLEEVLKDVILVGDQMAKDRQLAWQVRVPPNLPVIMGDRTRLRQILLNLLSNACKFTTRGEVGITVTVGEQEVTLAVNDSGLGIPLDEQALIFDEFHQSQRTATRGYGGMGLGLSITRRLVELHGGKIGLISSGQEGAGTTFYFTLPVQHVPLPLRTIKIDPACQQVVLILTQNKPVGDLLSAHLNRQGFTVMSMDISQDEHWLDKVLACPCGSIVLDCEPEMEWGWELMRNLKQHPDTQDIPVIFVNLLLEKDSGAVVDMNYLTKPLSLDALSHVLEQHGLVSGAKSPKSRRVLVVDDEPAILAMHAQLVQDHLPQCQVQTAPNGLQALDLMRKERPDLVLLDLMMPEMDGYGVLQAMQASESLRSIPVIIMTAQTLTEEMITHLNRSVAAVLREGMFSVDETLAHIETALTNDKNLGSEAQRIARRAMAYIHEHYPEPISRGDIADHIGVNERYLTHCFSNEVGITPTGYLNRYRVKMAELLLDAGSQSITEIGFAVGFSSSTYFSRVFQKEKGISPRDYLHRKA
jgi:signal transduction histidine kinase/DNA-binding LacI/PurR family transcriptional regulator/DNA-binding response OmpR family regulator